MNKIRITGGTMNVGQGVVIALTKEQASPRLHALESLGNDLFKAKQLLQFKAGEVIGIEINDIVKSERHMAVDAAMPIPVVEKAVATAKPAPVRRGR